MEIIHNTCQSTTGFFASMALSAVIAVSGGNGIHSRFEAADEISGSLTPTIVNIQAENVSGSRITFYDKSDVEDVLPKYFETIKKVFHLTNDELAKTLGVTRKTLHNWATKGEISSPTDKQRLFDLNLLAKNWQDLGLKQDKHSFGIKIMDGKSIKDLLSEKELNTDKVLFAGSRLRNLSREEETLF